MTQPRSQTPDTAPCQPCKQPERKRLSIKLGQLFRGGIKPHGKTAAASATGVTDMLKGGSVFYTFVGTDKTNIELQHGAPMEVCFSGEAPSAVELLVHILPVGKKLAADKAELPEGTLTYKWDLEITRFSPLDTGAEGLKAAQRMLNNLGIIATPEAAGNGSFDLGTRWAIHWFQQWFGVRQEKSSAINASRALDKLTWEWLDAAYGNFALAQGKAYVDNEPAKEPGLASGSASFSDGGDLRLYFGRVLQRGEFQANKLGLHGDLAMDCDFSVKDAKNFAVLGGKKIDNAQKEEGCDLFYVGKRCVRLDPDKDDKESPYKFERAGGKYHNTLALPEPVAWLQHNLYELGYQAHLHGGKNSFAGLPFNQLGAGHDGKFGRFCEWSVRFFQGYARISSTTAQEDAEEATYYINKLSQSAGLESGEKYSGTVTGAVNAATAPVLRRWLEKRYRCPVYIFGAHAEAPPKESRAETAEQPHSPAIKGFQHTGDAKRWASAGWQNLWLNTAMPKGAVAFSFDFSGRSMLDADAASRPRPVGLTAYSNDGPLGGSWLNDKFALSEAELTPQAVYGKGGVDCAGLSDEEFKEFKVIRPVADIECRGFADAYNAYDNSFLSIGPYHWTLGRSLVDDEEKEQGELGALFNRLYHHDNGATWAAYFGYLGCFPGQCRQLEAKWVAHLHLQREGDAEFSAATSKFSGSGVRVRAAQEYAFFSSWHAVYAAALAGRKSATLRQVMWLQARQRLHDLGRVKFAKDAENLPWLPAGSAGHLLLRDIFTSEKAWAMLLRWHVYRPEWLVNEKETARNKDFSPGAILEAEEQPFAIGSLISIVAAARGQHIADALKEAGADPAKQQAAQKAAEALWAQPPSQWDDLCEKYLVASIQAEPGRVTDQSADTVADLKKCLAFIATWPEKSNKRHRLSLSKEQRALSDKRWSFVSKPK